MKKNFITDLQVGQDLKGTAFAVKNITTRSTSAGKEYKDLILGDKTGDINAKIWTTSLSNCETPKNGEVVSIDALVEEYREKPQLNISYLQVLASDSIDLTEFMKSADTDLNTLYAIVDTSIKKMKDKYLKKLIGTFYGEKNFKERFKNAPGAQYIHHAYIGGLMEHVVEMLALADTVAELYPKINHDLLITGVLLHDIGKIDELTAEAAITRTRKGKLVGHIPMSSNLVYEAMKNIPDFPVDLSDQVLHLVLSHHGQLDYGSPVVPMTTEAFALHHIDQLSSKINIVYKKTLENSENTDSFTERIMPLGSELYIPNGKKDNKKTDTIEQTLF